MSNYGLNGPYLWGKSPDGKCIRVGEFTLPLRVGGEKMEGLGGFQVTSIRRTPSGRQAGEITPDPLASSRMLP